MVGPLDSAHAITKLPARDLDRARRFYRDRLGLEAVEERQGGLRYVCGTTEFHLFRVEVAGTWESSLAAAALGGEIAVVGFVGGRPAPSLDPYAIFTTGATLRPVAIGNRAQLVALVRAVGRHRIRPVLERVFPFDAAPEAFRHYLGGTALGKVVITFAPNHERI